MNHPRSYAVSRQHDHLYVLYARIAGLDFTHKSLKLDFAVPSVANVTHQTQRFPNLLNLHRASVLERVR